MPMDEQTHLNVLVVEDDQDMREFIEEILAEQGYIVTTVANGKEALARLEEVAFPVIVSDLKMPVMDGITLLEEIGARDIFKPFVILITAFGDIDDAITLINRGAYDYIIKPFKMEQLLISVRKAAAELAMRRKIETLEQISKGRHSLHDLIGKSPSMHKLFRFIEKIADTSGNVLLEGETGTGKEVIARAIHQISTRKEKPFVPVNCAAIPEGLLESELFGYVKGAFTDAASDKKGLFVEAADGTILLDEIGEMPVAIQAKILRVLQDRQIRPVGSNVFHPVEARILAATNKNLKEEVAGGRFREDLYYRLNIFKIEVPPLRERREDIPLLIREFLNRHERNGRQAQVSREVMRFFLDYPWPGNIRELENVIERCVFLAEGEEISLHDLPREMLAACQEQEIFSFAQIMPLADMEMKYIKYVLDKCKGNKQKTASLLGVNRKTIYRKVEE
ncbi:MAG: sigma-54 dependent transcriptional regulator [Proteobacteria bacterium]|nr:sigma-54 dependent transcriptional regulator [Pseudomonadota bacterium]MBU1058600.1 sigma-54 dependent transcriptional regulator [Pseudomonadota bacterium]